MEKKKENGAPVNYMQYLQVIGQAYMMVHAKYCHESSLILSCTSVLDYVCEK